MEIRHYNKTFRQLIVWQKAHSLTLLLYRITKSFPSDERFGMVSQLRRASYSVETQIAEGAMMRTTKHRRTFYNRALGSCVEIDNFSQLSFELGYITQEQYGSLLEHINKICYLLNHLIESLRNTPNQPNTPLVTLASHNHAPTTVR